MTPARTAHVATREKFAALKKEIRSMRGTAKLLLLMLIGAVARGALALPVALGLLVDLGASRGRQEGRAQLEEQGRLLPRRRSASGAEALQFHAWIESPFSRPQIFRGSQHERYERESYQSPSSGTQRIMTVPRSVRIDRSAYRNLPAGCANPVLV